MTTTVGGPGPAAPSPRLTGQPGRQRRSRGDWVTIAIPALLAYVPLLLTQPGWIGADTKTYLYLDPAKLLADAPYVWDSQIGMGTVTHQNIGYLFPMGPFYLVFDLLGLPDWVAQRLWLGTVMFLAAMGVRHLLHTLRFDRPPNATEPDGSGAADPIAVGGVLVASLAYMLSPYLLDYSARISVILLPWVALPWLIAVTAKALRYGGWWYPSVFALIVLAVGGINATALIMIGVGPLLWVVHAVWVDREVTLSDAVAVVGRIALLTLLTSLWWIAGLWAEGKYGLPVIRYTETYRAVAGSSNANEVLRGLGYWFFYGRDKLGPWIEPSVLYTTNLPVLFLSYALPVAALVSAALVRWRYRAYFLSLIVFGALIAIGGHPWENPSVLGGLFKEFTKTNAGLSLRSTPRAVPLVALGTAVFLGAGVTALGRWSRRVALPAAALASVLVVLNIPPLWNGTMIAENLRRPESTTTEGATYDYWYRAARWLDSRSHETRVLEVPGADFASYIWGNTVDPITPGLMDRGYLARELFQWGSPQSAAMLEAYDRRFQEGLAEPGAIAPIARMMGVGDIALRADIKHERYRTARPEQMWDLLTHAPGLGDPVAFTGQIFYPRDPRQPLVDEIELGKPRGLQDPPRLAVFPVDDPLPIVRAQSARRPLLVAGDADGLVDAAAMGILHPEQAIFFSASFAGDPDGFDRVYRSDAELLVTDTNRKRSHRWGALRETTGYTERSGERPAVYDPSDQRLEVFPGATDEAFTVSEQLGGATVTATAYGNPITFTPDDRAAMAFDGDPVTAWRVGAIDNPVGERITVALDEPITVDHLTLVQPLSNVRNRWIEQVRIHFDDGTSVVRDLSYPSREMPGETVAFDAKTTRRIEIEITRDSVGRRPRYDALSGVGFAEIIIPGVEVRELIRPPVDLLGRVGASSHDHRLSYLFTRQRSNPAEPVRGDAEQRIERIFSVPTDRRFSVSATARLSAHTPDADVDRMIGLPDAQRGGITATASAHLPASLRQRASAAIDGDPTTAWTSIYDKQEGHWLRFDLPEPVTFDHLDLTVLADFAHSVPTKLRIYADGRDMGVIDLPKVSAELERGHTATLSVPTPAITARSLRFVIEGSDDYTTTDWYTDRPIVLPISIAELSIDGVRLPAATASNGFDWFDSGCRTDLIEIDGTPYPIRISGPLDLALDREALTVEPCGDPDVSLTAGDHVIRTGTGRVTGIDIDRLLLASDRGGEPLPLARLQQFDAGPTPSIRTDEAGRISYDVAVDDATEPFWLTVGQSWNPGWEATIGGTSLGPPTVINGFANGWYVDPATIGQGSDFAIAVTWTPQRLVWIALALSAAGVIASLAVIAFAHRRPRHEGDPRSDQDVGPVAGGWPMPWPKRWRRPTAARGQNAPWRASILAGIGIGLFCLVNTPVGPAMLVAPVVGSLSALCTRRGPARGLLALLGAACLAGSALYYVVWQARYQFPADFVWPQLFERVHVLGLAALFLVGAEAVRELVWRPYADDGRPGTTIERAEIGD